MSKYTEITCPSCSFCRSIPLEKVPPNAVTVTCPKCKTAFPFDAHVDASPPHVELSALEAPPQAAADVTKAPLAPSPTAKKRLIDNPLVAQGVPLAVGIALYALGVPWYITLIVLLTAQYWFGPILIYFKQRMPAPQPLRAVPAETNLHPEHRLLFKTAIPALEAAGFKSMGCFTNAPEGQAISGIIALLQHEYASDVAHLIAVVNDGRVGKNMGFSRPRADGSRLTTSCRNLSSPFPPNPRDNVLRVEGELALQDLWRVHQARTAVDKTVIRQEPISDAVGYQMNEERQGAALRLASGQWQPAKETGFIRPTLAGSYVMCLRMLFPWRQLDRMRAKKEMCRLLKESGGAPLGEIKALETAKDSTDVVQDLELASLVTELQALASTEKKSGSLALLIVTVMIFFSAQIVSTKWQELLILMGVLFFHELGHLAAMKLLKYKDLKMFFIPFLGAAVSGKNSNPTAVKSCVVSLMGPVPGIVLSVPLFLLFLLSKHYYLFKTAQVMLLLNVFNLLPIMPLDGGRFVDVLFVNRKYFRFVFSFLGAAAFLFLAYSSHDFLLVLLGCLTIYTALSNLKLHGISHELKAEGLTADSVTEFLDDEDALKRVVGKMREGFPKLFSPNIDYKGIFNKLQVVVDTMKFKPAKFLPKTFLLTTYAGCTVVSILGLFVLVGANYRECARTVDVDGMKQTYVERHVLGKKQSECLINSNLYYDGKGTAYAKNGSVSDVYYYKDGYRTGEWLTFGLSGEVTEKRIYDRGKLLKVSTLENGAWKSTTVEEMPYYKRWSEEIQRMAQPFRSNHEYF